MSKPSKPRLFSYKMTDDTGFAPNPFWGFLSLATCKPGIRNTKEVDNWIAGFTSKTLCGDEVGEERLVFLMQVTNKILFDEYFNNPMYRHKIPDLNRTEVVYKTGDNIYEPKGNEYNQLDNKYHGPDEKPHDLSSKFVLISSNFIYFGRDAQTIPADIKPSVPSGPTNHGFETRDAERANAFISFVTSKYKWGVLSPPHKWPEHDQSWQSV